MIALMPEEQALFDTMVNAHDDAEKLYDDGADEAVSVKASLDAQENADKLLEQLMQKLTARGVVADEDVLLDEVLAAAAKKRAHRIVDETLASIPPGTVMDEGITVEQLREIMKK